MLYRTRPNVRMTRSRLIERLVCDSNSMRKGKLRIKNVRLGKTIYWDHTKPLTKEMIEDGWEYGLYLNAKQLNTKSENSCGRRWMCKEGCDDVFVKGYEVKNYIDIGYRFGRLNLPDGFHERFCKIAATYRQMTHGVCRGKISIYDPLTLRTKLIGKNDKIPNGWKPGRGYRIRERVEKCRKLTPLYNEYKSLFYDYGKLKSNHSELKMSHKTFLQICRKFTDVYETRSVRNRNLILKYFELFTKYGYQAVADFGYTGVRHSLLALFRHNGLR